MTQGGTDHRWSIYEERPWTLSSAAGQPPIVFLDLSSPKPRHTTGGSGQGGTRLGGARQGGGAGRGGAGRDADGSVRPENDRPSCPPGHRGQTVLNNSSEARTNEILFKPTEELWFSLLPCLIYHRQRSLRLLRGSNR